MATIDTASRQWATRPADQRFLSLTEMLEASQNYRMLSRASVYANRDIRLSPVDGDSKALVAVNREDEPVLLTHWSFGQLATLASAPAGYLRTLPGPMTADLLNFGLHHARDVESVGVLEYDNEEEDVHELRAATGPNYGRIWNADILRQLVDRFGDGIEGPWKVPGEFGKKITVTKANTTLYASDRDMFVFLADEERRITIPDRRDGKKGTLARGAFFWNSEVGAATFGVATFLFDYACKNRIVWGAEEYKEIKIRHTSGAPHRWLEEVVPALTAYAESSDKPIIAAIEAARGERVDGEKLDEFLAARFSKGQVSGIKLAHQNDEGRPMESVWDIVVGATAYARGINHQDARVAVERTAGQLLREVGK